ncbi:MAG: DUF805 domain-containing protein [Proteobacteria bacterium]|nr:DUF805 domain-containing protein [Pseudomonadota bacterium]
MLRPYTRFFDFFGRANRREFWLFAIFYLCASFLLLWSALLLGLLFPFPATATVLLIAFYLFAWGSLIPLLAVAIRRLHDIGRSGWWILLGLSSVCLLIPPSLLGGWRGVLWLPVVAMLALLVMLMWRGEAGINRFGTPP